MSEQKGGSSIGFVAKGFFITIGIFLAISALIFVGGVINGYQEKEREAEAHRILDNQDQQIDPSISGIVDFEPSTKPCVEQQVLR